MQTTAAALRKADPRFARLTVELKPDGGLFVSGWSAKPSDVWDFATELRKVPGVVRVTVDPQFSAPAPGPAPAAEPAPFAVDQASRPRSRRSTWDPQAVGVLRVTGAAAIVTALSMWIG